MHRLIGNVLFMQTRLYKKVHRLLSCLEFYMTHEWRFVSCNPTELMNKMTMEDRLIFNFDVRQINWKNYIESYVSGIRTFVLNEDATSLSLAKENFNR